MCKQNKSKRTAPMVLPCPFCGNAPKVFRRLCPAPKAYIICKKCRISSPNYSRPADARRFWNRRRGMVNKRGLGLHKTAKSIKATNVDLLSTSEIDVAERLAEAWSAFLKLETLHDDHVHDFRKAIHDAQNIVMARPAQRQFNKQ